jgi:hypothetical protein
LKNAVASLIKKRHIERLGIGAGPERSVYRVNVQGVTKTDRSKIDRSEFDRPDFDRLESDRPIIGRSDSNRSVIDDPLSEIDRGGGSDFDPIIKINSSIETTHTPRSVSVGSRFSLEECRRYAEQLKQTGQGITNPGGYATKIFRSGEADAFIDAFLNPPTPIDIAKCPACGGSNFVYIDTKDPDRGVKPCRHVELRNRST